MSADTTIIESLGIYLPPQSVSTAQMLNECTNRIRLPFEALSGHPAPRISTCWSRPTYAAATDPT